MGQSPRPSQHARSDAGSIAAQAIERFRNGHDIAKIVSETEEDLRESVVLEWLHEYIRVTRKSGLYKTLHELVGEFPELSTLIAQVYPHLNAECKHPTTLGNYKVLSHIGRGGQGNIVRAESGEIERSIKYTTNNWQAELLKKESRYSTETANHPFLRTIYEFSTQDKTTYLVLEYVNSDHLERIYSSDDARKPTEVTRVMRDISSGVACLHSNGIAHRDLKPANILIASDGTPRIIDLGLAEKQNYEGGDSSDATYAGTVGYAAPECIYGVKKHDLLKADIFSLGCVFYFLLTGEHPKARGRSADSGWIPDLAERREMDGFPADLISICNKCLRHAPNSRYRSAGEVETALEEVQRILHRKNSIEKVLIPIRVALATITLLFLLFGMALRLDIEVPFSAQAQSRNSQIEEIASPALLDSLKAALEVADVSAIRSYLDDGGTVKYVTRAFGLAATSKGSVAESFFRASRDADLAGPLLQELLSNGLDPNLVVQDTEYERTGILNLAIRTSNAKMALCLLDAGASPHAFQTLQGCTYYGREFLFPYVGLLNNDSLRREEKAQLAQAFQERGAIVPANHQRDIAISC